MSEPVPDRSAVLAERKAEYGCAELFRGRWSPKALRPDNITEADVLRLCEAARWAPSAFNEQPWRFVWIDRSHPRWPDAVGLMSDSNRAWAHKAGALIFVFAHREVRRTGAANRTWQFDTGLAVMSLVLQAELDGLATHLLGGINHDAALAAWGPAGDDWESICAVVVARVAREAAEPAMARQPGTRRPLSETATRVPEVRS